MSKKRRIIEGLKDLLIAGLVCSALWLAWESRMFRVSGMLEPVRPVQQSDTRSAAVSPLHIAVMNVGGCCGVQYDSGALSAVFNRVAPVLNEALSGAEMPRPITREEWEELLISAPGVYFDFQGAMPLGVLAGRLSGQENPALTARARHLLLASDGKEGVVLAYRDEDSGQYAVCSAGLVSLNHLQSAVTQVQSNGAIFACQASDYAQILAPYTIITAQTPAPKEYTASNPLPAEEEQRLELLLEALSFPPEITTVYDTPEGRRARSGNDTLSVSNGGLVTYYSTPQEQRYPVAAAEGTSPVFAAVDSATRLVYGVLDLWRGEARVYLAHVEPRGEDGWRMEYRYALNDTPVQVGQRGYAATVLVEQGCITEFELQLRTYTALEQTTLILPQRQAAAAMTELGKQGGQLQLCYQDNGDTIRAGWVVEE